MRERSWPSPHEVFEARFARFLKELAVYERAQRVRETTDAFLDAYSLWRRTHQMVWRVEAERLAGQLHTLDVRFEFHFDREPVA